MPGSAAKRVKINSGDSDRGRSAVVGHGAKCPTVGVFRVTFILADESSGRVE